MTLGVVEVTTVGPPEIWYETTPTLSVEAAQDRSAVVAVTVPRPARWVVPCPAGSPW